MATHNNNKQLSRSIGTWEVMVAGVALVVAASTLVSDLIGFFTLGAVFVVALVLGFAVNLLLGISAADLSVSYPRAGALYEYARKIFRGRAGEFAGVFLGLAFFGMFAFAASGEVSAGAFGLQSLLPGDLSVTWSILALAILAVIPNIFGIRTTAWVSAGLLIGMLGIRWFFGIAGFLGFSNTGGWSAANLDAGIGLTSWFGDGGILSVGLALAFWSFLGIEFACSLAEEVETPRKAMPRGIIFGLVGILGTSLVMGLGITGTLPVSEWQTAVNGELGHGGEAPQIAVGQLMFGQLGRVLMALSSIAATLGSLTVALAAMPRIIYSLARDGNFFGPASRFFGKLHPKFGTPVAATLLAFVVYTIPSLFSAAVVEWVYSPAYCWTILYIVFHILAIANRIVHPTTTAAFSRRGLILAASTGILTTGTAIYFAFAGSHLQYGLRALVVLSIAVGIAALSFYLKTRYRTPVAVARNEVSEIAVRRSA